MDPLIPAVLDEALGFNLYRVALLFRRELVAALAQWRLSAEQWQVLAALGESADPPSQQEVAHLTLKDKHTVSRMLERLERDGWIERAADAGDARTVRVRPTARARREYRAMRRAVAAHFKPILARLEPRERRLMLGALKTLRHYLEERP